MKSKIIPKTYIQTLQVLKERIYHARYTALLFVNRELVRLYWDIGRIIVERQEKEGWGKAVVEQLSKDLQIEFPGIRGFSIQNLWYMKRFYSLYRENLKLQPLVGEIGWAHNIIVMDKCEKDTEREYYIKMTIREKWSKRTLEKRIIGKEFEKWALKQTNFADTLPKSLLKNAEVLVKDDYNFDFLLLERDHQERVVETALVKNIVAFLAEMGGYFSFIGRQQKLVVGGDEYFIDLLFYHRKLRCLVAIELKAEEFKPEHGGKMQFYLSALDEQVRLDGENLSIGIIICKKKDRMVVEYTLRDVRRPIGVGTYNQYSNLHDIPKEIAKYLPSETEIKKRLGNILH